MNRINVQQTGGFPLETDTLNEMQKAYEIFNSLGNIIAPLAIIKGCELTGNYVANGVVYIQGEVLEFRGGSIGDTVIIKEDDPEDNKRLFQNGDNKLVYRKRYATFGSSVVNDNFLWADFYRSITIKKMEEKVNDTKLLEELEKRVNKLELFSRPFVTGQGAVLFLRPANEIPEGWEEVKELRGRFPIGQNPADPALSNVLQNYLGGSKTAPIYKSNLPNIGISYKDAYYIENTTKSGLGGSIYIGEGNFGSNRSDDDNNRLLYRNASTEPLGQGVELNVMNPYRIVLFIKPIV